MTRSVLTCVLVVGLSSSVFAQCCGSPVPTPVVCGATVTYGSLPVCVVEAVPTHTGGGGLLAALNAPLVPGLPTMPGIPAPSVLGLVAPRLSLLSSFVQYGGFSAPNPGQYLIGIAAPRLAPLVALQAGTIQPQQALLGVLAPRAAVGLQLAQGFGGGGGLFGRRGCR